MMAGLFKNDVRAETGGRKARAFWKDVALEGFLFEDTEVVGFPTTRLAFVLIGEDW